MPPLAGWSGGGERLVQQRPLRRHRGRGLEAGGKMRGGDDHPAGTAREGHPRGARRVVHGFLEEQDVEVAGGAGHEVLRPLKDEIPTKMRQAKQKRFLVLGRRRQSRIAAALRRT